MKSCAKCHSVFDPATLPKVNTTIRQTATVPRGKQVDIRCPRCGALLLRTIDGVEIAADYKDTRAEQQAVKIAAATAANAKADTKAKGKVRATAPGK